LWQLVYNAQGVCLLHHCINWWRTRVSNPCSHESCKDPPPPSAPPNCGGNGKSRTFTGHRMKVLHYHYATLPIKLLNFYYTLGIFFNTLCAYFRCKFSSIVNLYKILGSKRKILCSVMTVTVIIGKPICFIR